MRRSNDSRTAGSSASADGSDGSTSAGASRRAARAPKNAAAPARRTTAAPPRIDEARDRSGMAAHPTLACRRPVAAFLHLHGHRLRLRLLGLRKRHDEQSVREPRGDLLRVDVARELERADELAVAALVAAERLAVGVRGALLLAAD